MMDASEGLQYMGAMLNVYSKRIKELEAENARLRDFIRIEADALEENGFSVDADRFRAALKGGSDE
jgi:hypothetical protein